MTTYLHNLRWYRSSRFPIAPHKKTHFFSKSDGLANTTSLHHLHSIFWPLLILGYTPGWSPTDCRWFMASRLRPAPWKPGRHGWKECHRPKHSRTSNHWTMAPEYDPTNLSFTWKHDWILKHLRLRFACGTCTVVFTPGTPRINWVSLGMITDQGLNVGIHPERRGIRCRASPLLAFLLSTGRSAMRFCDTLWVYSCIRTERYTESIRFI